MSSASPLGASAILGGGGVVSALEIWGVSEAFCGLCQRQPAAVGAPAAALRALAAPRAREAGISGVLRAAAARRGSARAKPRRAAAPELAAQRRRGRARAGVQQGDRTRGGRAERHARRRSDLPPVRARFPAVSSRQRWEQRGADTLCRRGRAAESDLAGHSKRVDGPSRVHFATRRRRRSVPLRLR